MDVPGTWMHTSNHRFPAITHRSKEVVPVMAWISRKWAKHRPGMTRRQPTWDKLPPVTKRRLRRSLQVQWSDYLVSLDVPPTPSLHTENPPWRCGCGNRPFLAQQTRCASSAVSKLEHCEIIGPLRVLSILFPLFFRMRYEAAMYALRRGSRGTGDCDKMETTFDFSIFC